MNKDITKLIGIGASAGGLDAIQMLFTRIPKDTGFAFVVIQHLSPDYKSLMPELLSKYTEMPIITAKDKLEIKPNCVYLNQNKKNLRVKGSKLYLLDKGPKKNINLPIDLFLESLGKEWKEKAIGVILSGTGSDGSRGIKSIHENGGLIFVQSPETAQFDGMPKASIATGLPDLIMEAKEIGDTISTYPVKNLNEILENESDEKVFNNLLKEVYRLRGIDFTLYKQNTIMRRIEKRIHQHKLKNLKDYFIFLVNNEQEVEALCAEFLIGVTGFFRDPEAFKVLQDKILPEICRDRNPSEELRIWVPGCSTGEEAYSIAMALDHYIAETELNLQYKIFATDMHEEALLKAGLGVYSINTTEDMSKTFLEKYFSVSGDEIQIAKHIRERIVFSLNNVTNDPPFIQTDLISCRNLLIYLNNSAQESIIHNFLFSLNRNGFLFLGQSEGLGKYSEEFKVVDSKHKLFQSLHNPNRLSPSLKVDNKLGSYPAGFSRNVVRNNEQLSELAYYKFVSSVLNPKMIFIDDDYHVTFTIGIDSNKLKPKDGFFNTNILNLVDRSLATIIRNGIRRVRSNHQTVKIEDISFDVFSTVVSDITISEANMDDHGLYAFLLEFGEEHERSEPKEIAMVEFADIASQRIEDLEYELKVKNDELKNLIEELETSNEELQSSNEELMASNEELQSTNEELQSVNEELYTVNAELQEKNKEVQEIYDDLANLYDSQDIATIFLDQQLRIRNFTPAIKQHMDLGEVDIGRSISNFMFFEVETRELLLKEVKKVLKSGTKYERQVIEKDQHYILRLYPFMKDDEIDGVVMSLIDVNDLVSTQQELMKAERAYETLFKNANVAFSVTQLVYDEEGNAINQLHRSVNKEFEEILGVKSKSILNKPLEAFGFEEKVVEKLTQLADRVYKNKTSHSLELYFEKFKKYLQIKVFPAGEENMVGWASLDITEEKKSQSTIKEANEKLNLSLRLDQTAFWEWDLQWDEIISYNAFWESIFEHDPKNASVNLRAAIHKEDKKRVWKDIRAHIDGETEFFSHEYRLYNKDKTQIKWIKSQGKVTEFDSQRQALRVIGSSRDITADKETERTLEKAKNDAIAANRQKDLFLSNLSHEIRTPMNGVLGFSHLLKKDHLDPEDKSRFIAQIEENSNQLMTIINDVLSMAKMESGQFTINIEDVDLDPLLIKIVENHQEQLYGNKDKKNLKVVFMPAIKHKQSLIIKSDPVRLAQVINNLVTNAIKFSSKGTIEIGYQLDDEQQTIHLWVKDEGIGIKKDQQKAIFDRFSQVQEKLSMQVGGIGLGLAITKSIVDVLGGSISLKSAYRKGSTFTISLPFEGDYQLGTQHRKVEKIIIADDSPSIHFYYQSLLKDHEVTLLQALDGKEVLELLKEHKNTDLILMDIRMPVMDGPTALKELRKFNKKVKVVAQSAFALDEQIERFKEQGFDEYLTKPIEEGKILELIS